jgi:hypothetical protein
MTGTLGEDVCAFMVISGLIIVRLRNVPEKSRRENQNTHFVFSFFPEYRALFDMMWKNNVDPGRPLITM